MYISDAKRLTTEGARKIKNAAVKAAEKAGIPITAETCPQYLTLTAQHSEELGPLMKVYPPVRHQEDQDALWQAINNGTITSVGSDHAPHLVAEKMAGFESAPAGGLGIETLAPLMVDAMCRGRLTPQRLAEVLSSSTAKLYGLFPRKGALRPAADADLTLVDPTGVHTVRNEELHALNPVSTWDGWKLQGRITASILGGRVAMRNSEPVGERGGRFVRAEHRGAGTADAS